MNDVLTAEVLRRFLALGSAWDKAFLLRNESTLCREAWLEQKSTVKYSLIYSIAIIGLVYFFGRSVFGVTSDVDFDTTLLPFFLFFGTIYVISEVEVRQEKSLDRELSQISVEWGHLTGGLSLNSLLFKFSDLSWQELMASDTNFNKEVLVKKLYRVVKIDHEVLSV